ncbi:hypothetical protein [Paracraurococcus lichenis]|uniref:Integrase catalytic domain-containing protein n=1 Tax=Paracraurococcus lichenis TaxID=3064888 RepID=A0ABT9EEP8_9PROT|nr:hypothetical protein [Paracraurococcus sp. LOR1-02]MDO9714345.1 hypothetical protein [Paracraurococcus sp. LOR1-02]
MPHNCDFGFVHIDVCLLPTQHVGDGKFCKRYLYVAIERWLRSAHSAIRKDMTARRAVAFLKEASAVLAFRITDLLTHYDRCFITGAFREACAALGVQHRMTTACMPQTYDAAEKFMRPFEQHVLGIPIDSHLDLERMFSDYNQAYNARPQGALEGKSPDQVVRARLAGDSKPTQPSRTPINSGVRAKAVIAAKKRQYPTTT